jgi:hypothetical protein
MWCDRLSVNVIIRSRDMSESNNMRETPTGQTFTTIKETGPITVKRITYEYIEALEKMTGSAVIGVNIDVEREFNRDGYGVIATDYIIGAETHLVTR